MLINGQVPTTWDVEKMMRKKHEPPDIRKAHDVRHLCVCKGCGEIGDDRRLIQIDGTNMHGDCAFKFLGMGILQLPPAERLKFTIGEIGPEAMRELMRASAEEASSSK